MVFASMFNISYYARAYTVDAAKLLKTIDDKNTYAGENLVYAKDIRYVGNGYIITQQDADGYEKTLFTSDFVNFQTVILYNDANAFDPFSRMGNMDEIIWTDGAYIARSDVYDNMGKSGRVLEDYSYLYLLNEQFDLVKKIKFDHYIKEMSYVNGYYYVCISNGPYLQENEWG